MAIDCGGYCYFIHKRRDEGQGKNSSCVSSYENTLGRFKAIGLDAKC